MRNASATLASLELLLHPGAVCLAVQAYNKVPQGLKCTCRVPVPVSDYEICIFIRLHLRYIYRKVTW